MSQLLPSIPVGFWTERDRKTRAHTHTQTHMRTHTLTRTRARAHARTQHPARGDMSQLLPSIPVGRPTHPARGDMSQLLPPISVCCCRPILAVGRHARGRISLGRSMPKGRQATSKQAGLKPDFGRGVAAEGTVSNRQRDRLEAGFRSWSRRRRVGGQQTEEQARM